MKTAVETSDNLYFLSGGGKMGELTRNYNWSETPVGAPENWPLSLRLTLSMILSSKFPMFLWWGEDLVQFYNDAYRPSFGNNGKHPLALGQKAKDCWPEIWDIIYPLIQQVRNTAQATWSEDQLIPIYRNGKIEDVYWTFGYSPIFDETQKVEGVLVVCTETTEKVQTRKALEQSEQRFRTMAESTDILIALSDADGNVTYFNNAWSTLTGKPISELLKLGWLDLIHPHDRERYLNIYLSAFNKKEAFTGEFRILNAQGEYRWLLAKGPLRFSTDGSFTDYISSWLDITERKNSEEKVRQSEEQVRAIIESAPFPIGVYVGEEMRIELANKAMLAAWGKGDNVTGKIYRDILPELNSQDIFNQLDDVYATGIAFHARNKRVDIVVDGRLQAYYFNYSFTPLYNTDGKVYGVINTGADVTDLNIAKQKIEQSEINFRNIIIQAPVAMCLLLGASHVVEVANVPMIELWGKSPEEVINKPIFEGLPDAREQGLEQLLSHVYNTGETYKANELPVRLLRYGVYETVYQNFVYEPYKDSDGVILGVLAISIDVTKQVLARQKIEEVIAKRTKELADANNNLQKSNAELAQFAYIASHDLQEPLRKISTFTQMLESRIANNIDEQSKNYLSKITSSSARMNTLIRDVLTYSELVKETEVFTTVDLNQVIINTITDYELLIEQKGAIVRYKNLPVIEAIPLQMAQLFGNIIGNALKFSREGIQPIITIAAEAITTAEEKETLSLSPALTYFNIKFTDNGIGFREEYATRIFNIFQRLHRKSEYEGTGIGLAMCKKIALNHHGDLNAKGSSENGAVFNVILPLKQLIIDN